MIPRYFYNQGKQFVNLEKVRIQTTQKERTIKTQSIFIKEIVD